MKAALFIVFALLLIVLHVSEAQVPGWEPPIQLTDLPSNSSVMSACSNGYGQHVLVQGSNTVDYFLLGNNGDSIYTAPPFPVTAQNGSITGYQDELYIALDISDQIKVYSSTNGVSHGRLPVLTPYPQLCRTLMHSKTTMVVTLFGIRNRETKCTMFCLTQIRVS